MHTRRRSLVLGVGLLLLAACSDAPPTSPDLMAPDARSGSVIANDAIPTTTGNHLVVFMGTRVPDDLEERVEAAGGELLARYDVVGGARVAGLDAAGVEALRSYRDTWYVEDEPYITLPAPAAEPEALPADFAIGPESPDDPTTAFFYARQWHLRAIQADMAWAEGSYGSEDVTVAILDTGIDYDYPDLQGRVDLSRSISLQPMDDLYAGIYFPGKHPITDLHYHGTHVASTVVSNGYVNAGVTSKT